MILRITLGVLSLAGVFLCLFALVTGNQALGLIGSLGAFLVSAFQLGLTFTRKKRHTEQPGSQPEHTKRG